MSTPARVDILVDIKARLDELLKTQQELRRAREEAQGFGSMLKTGFGIDFARRAVDLFKASAIDGLRSALRLADEVENGSRALGMSTQAYQVLRNAIKETNGEVGALTTAVNSQMQSLDAARNITSSAAAAYRTLGLNPGELEKMPIEERMEAIARASANAKDKTAAYRATAELLGSRTLPQLQGALKELAEKGYRALAEEQQKAGKVLDDSAIQDLSRLKDQLEQLQQQRDIAAGEILSFYQLLARAVVDDPIGLLMSPFAASDTVHGSTADFLSKYMPKPRAKTPAPAQTDNIPLQQQPAWIEANLELTRAQLAQSLAEADASANQADRRKKLADAIRDEVNARTLLLGLLAKDTSLAPETLAALKERLEYEQKIALLRESQTMFPQAQKSALDDSFQNLADGRDDKGSKLLTAGEGFTAGLQQWALQTGTYGQQIASTLTSTVGGAVNTLSNGIMGLITKTKSLGDVGREMGMMFVQALVQMIVQALAFAAVIAIMNAIAPGSGTAAAVSYSKAQGRESGGPVAVGQPYIIGEKRPEVFVPTVPGSIVPSVDAYRVMSRRSGGGSGIANMGPGGAAPVAARPQRDVWVVGDLFTAQQLARDASWDTHVMDTVNRHRGGLLDS